MVHSSEAVLCNFQCMQVLHYTTNKNSASQYCLAVLNWSPHTVEPLGIPGNPFVSGRVGTGNLLWGVVWGDVHWWF